jgi:hypothetical protein
MEISMDKIESKREEKTTRINLQIPSDLLTLDCSIETEHWDRAGQQPKQMLILRKMELHRTRLILSITWRCQKVGKVPLFDQNCLNFNKHPIQQPGGFEGDLLFQNI